MIPQKEVLHMQKAMKQRRRFRELMDYVIFMGPALLLFITLCLVPFLQQIWYSFTNWDGIKSSYAIVGLKNYIRVMSDTKYWTSMLFTLKFTFFATIFSNLLGFFWAYWLSKRIPFRNLMRAGFYLPKIVGGVILGFVWRFIFQNFFPVLAKITGIAWLGQTWFSTASSSFWALVIVMTWSSAGYMMIIYLAGLTSISDDYIEAATVDGAKNLQILFKVVIPLIMPSITQCLFLSIVNCLRMYDLNISLTNGNPFRMSEAVTMNVYQTAFSSNQLGYGSAKALILVLIIAFISILQVSITSRREVTQ